MNVKISDSCNFKTIKKISFKIVLKLVRDESTSTLKTINYNSIKALSEDFSKFYDDSADITILCGKGEFQVHKHILMARSPVFKAMFE